MRALPVAAASYAALVAATAAFVIFPIASTLVGALAGPARPGGFGQHPGTLFAMASNSLTTSVLGSLLALAVVFPSSAASLANSKFSRFYRLWLVVMLFTNPVFFVLGLSTLLASWPPLIAVTVATAYVVLPLGGLIVQSAFDEFPRVQLLAARALGGDFSAVLWRHIVPASFGQLVLAAVLMAVYALGFYLLPTFVGFGRVSTLSTSISTLASRVGDWSAAQQIALLLLLVEFAALMFLLATRLAVRGSIRR